PVRTLVDQLEGELVVVERSGEFDAAAVRAAGAEAATHEHVVFLGPDLLVQPGWLPRLLDCLVLDDDDVDVACSAVVRDDRGHLVEDDDNDDTDWARYEVRPIAGVGDGAVAVRGAALEHVRASGSFPTGATVLVNPTSWVLRTPGP
ncbi:MAG: hypothetical protein JWO69_1453, partial [Thermoleophilia bacterium]|nr:hypothetical protein [Thermoleophilia bacterium]